MKYAVVFLTVGMIFAGINPSVSRAEDTSPSLASPSQGDLIKAILDGYKAYLAIITTKINEADASPVAETKPVSAESVSAANSTNSGSQKPTTGSLQTGHLQTGTLKEVHLDGYPSLPSTSH